MPRSTFVESHDWLDIHRLTRFGVPYAEPQQCGYQISGYAPDGQWHSAKTQTLREARRLAGALLALSFSPLPPEPEDGPQGTTWG